MSPVVESVALVRPEVRRRSAVAEVGLVASSVVLYSVLCFLAPVVPSVAYRHAREILAVERALGVDIELGLNQWLADHPVIASVSSTFYSVSFFAFTVGALVLIWTRRPDRYILSRNSLFIMTAGAMITYWAFPLAPPRFLTTYGFVDSVATQSTVGSGYSEAAGSLANQYAAMPSMHTGWAVWCALFLGLFVWKATWQRLLLAIHPLFTIWVIIATANHYVLDAIAGASYCAVGFVLAVVVQNTILTPDTPNGQGYPRIVDKSAIR